MKGSKSGIAKEGDRKEEEEEEEEEREGEEEEGIKTKKESNGREEVKDYELVENS